MRFLISLLLFIIIGVLFFHTIESKKPNPPLTNSSVQTQSLQVVTPTENADEIVHNYFTKFPVVVSPSPAVSYRQTFVSTCGFGEVYCTCLYDYLSQYYNDYQIQRLQENDPEMINGESVCNNRFR